MKRRRPGLVFALDLLGLAVLAFVVAIVVLHAYDADWGYLIGKDGEGGDVTYSSAYLFKGSVDNAWYLHNQFLDAPFGLDLHDFPAPDLVAFGMIKLLGLFTGTWARIENLYFLGSYPVTAVVAFVALRHFGIRRALAGAAAIAFAFLPYHQMRGFGHIFFGCTYWQAALTAVLAAWLAEDRPFFVATRTGSRLPRLVLDRVSATALALALVVGMTGMVYYPYFSVGCLLVGAVSGALATRSWTPLLRGAVTVGVIGAGLAVDLAPTMLYQLREGRVASAPRSSGDAETFALKLTDLVLPPQGHRLGALSTFRKGYDAVAPLTNENVTAYLGVVAVVGLLILAFLLFFPRNANAKLPEGDDGRAARLLVLFARCSAFSFLLGTVGGLGSLVAFTVFNKVRSYNRISPFIAFFCLAAVALVAEQALRRMKRGDVARGTAWVGAVAVTLVALWDQTISGPGEWKKAYRRQDDLLNYYRGVEASLPADAAVFELPFMPFPEGPTQGELTSYDESEPYLFTKRLHYSFPSMPGRPSAAWHARLAGVPPEDLAKAVSLAGFDGIFVFRVAYPDHAEQLESRLTEELGSPPVVGPDGRVAFFGLADYRKALLAKLGPEAAAYSEFYRLLPELDFSPASFSPMERLGDRSWHWMTSPSGSIVVRSRLDHAVKVDVGLTAFCECDGAHSLRLTGPAGTRSLEVARKPLRVAETIELPPGETILRIETDAPPFHAPNDSRSLYVQLSNPTVQLAR